MLPELLVPLAGEYQFFNLFRYITFRTGRATITALILSLVRAGADPLAEAHQAEGQPIRAGGPDRTFEQGRNADHGRAADPRRLRAVDPALDAAVEPLSVAGASWRLPSAPSGRSMTDGFAAARTTACPGG